MASQQFDVEDESILSTIFKDSFQESWRENPDFAHYLAELSSFGIEKLNNEPDRLAEERSQILEQTQDLAFHNYKTFIQTADCSREIFQDFQIIEKHVDSLLDKLPTLSTECTKFISTAQDINVSRRVNTVTLSRHTQLLEVLEMPQLMDTCVRNGYYEEALELATHVKRLEKKHANIPIIMSIVEEVKQCSQLMLNQLLGQLRTAVQLPACLRVIGYLRRMDAFTEPQLRIKFLQARDSWFQGILDAIPTDDAYYHITKTIEASRVHLFDIITQYRAIFSDDEPLLSSSKDDALNDGALFHGWVVHKVSQFLQTLERDLVSGGIGGRLDSLLGQCMYFGLSFSRVGADFRGLLAPIFQQAALRGFVQAIQETDHSFDAAMQSYTLLGTPSMLPSSAFTMATQGSGSLQPPVILLEFPPLAAYCNNILTSFNELRLCVPLSLASDVAMQLQASLTTAAQSILAYHRAEATTLNTEERGRFGQLCTVFADELLPYLNRCLHTLFPPSQIATVLGVQLSAKLGNIGVVDIQAVIEPIEHLIPAKPTDNVSTDPIGADSAVTAKEEDLDQSEDLLQTEEKTEVAKEEDTEESVEKEEETEENVKKEEENKERVERKTDLEESFEKKEETVDLIQKEEKDGAADEEEAKETMEDVTLTDEEDTTVN